ncbi:MAG: type II toxin-antitoxin system Phd/YefM family antitoxin, partial [Acetobacteraceae bacterium]
RDRQGTPGNANSLAMKGFGAYIPAMSAAMKSPVPTEGAIDRLAALAEQAEHDKERVVLTRAGKPVAAVVPIEDLEAMEAAEDAQDAAETQRLIAEWEAAGRPLGATLEELAARHGIALEPDAE